MSGRGHVAGAALGLVGLVGASALAGVTSLHVDLEHGHTHELEARDHGHSHADTNTGHGHSPAVPDHGHAHQVEAPDHDHALALVGNVERRVGRAPIEPLRVAPVVPFVTVSPPGRSLPGRFSGAGPPARAAPLARRSVVLQV